MVIRCPGCLTRLAINEEDFESKVLLKCPQCLFIFLLDEKSDLHTAEYGGKEQLDEATLLVSDLPQEKNVAGLQWNVPEASLTIIQGQNEGVHIRLTKDRLIIGREKADLTVPDLAVSRRHAEIEKKGEWYLIRDLNSKNGTFVNEERVDEAKLRNLDEIRVGETVLLFSVRAADQDRENPDASGEREAILAQERTDIDTDAAEKPLPLPQRRKLIFEIMQGPGKGKSLTMESGRAIIGRSEEAQLRLEDFQVSRKHAQVEAFSREQIFITDLASQNGTYINGVRVRTTKLKHGDLIRLGNTVLKFITMDTPEGT